MLTLDVSKLATMAESFGERIKRLRKAAGLSQEQLAKRIGVARAAVTQWETGVSGGAESKNLLRAAEVLGVDPIYLQKGGGPPPGIGEEGALYHPQLITRAGSLRNIPIVGFAIATPDQDGYFDDMGFPAGAGMEYLPWPTKDPDAYGLRVRGDSMQPRIRPGQIIVVEPSATVSNLDDVLVRLANGRRMVKQLLNRRGREVTFGSINQAHKQTTISLEDVESIHFVAAIVSRTAGTEEERS